MQTIDDYIKLQEAKMTWLDRLFMNYPRITKTATLALKSKKLTPGVTTVITPSITQKIIALVILLFPFLFWINFLSCLFTRKDLLGLSIFGLLFTSCIMAVIIYYSFINKNYHFQIMLTGRDICIKNSRWQWDDIIETYLMQRQSGRSTNYYLLLHTKSKGFAAFDLFKFGIPVSRLSALIEHYKTLHYRQKQ